MKKLIILTIVSILFFLFSFLAIAKTGATPEILGKYPVCEPSAAAKVTDSDSGLTYLLVGDNESKESVFLYSINLGKLDPNSQKELNLGGEEISDIEAIAKLAEDRVLIFGSHSRNNKCEIKEKRQRFLQAKVLRDRLKPIGGAIKSSQINSTELFAGINIHNSQILQAVSNAIDGAERAADLAEGDSAACQITNAFNAEGAVAIPNKSYISNVWVGLRSPLVFLNQKNFAILMRMKDINKYQFDEVALLDLGGRGIRELTLNGEFIWGIAGGTEDETDNFVLWKIPARSLKSNAIIKPKIIRNLPPSSEGLAIVDSTVYVLIDGDVGSSDSKCKFPGKFIDFFH